MNTNLKDIVGELHFIYCPYGQADGPDDFCKDCECDEDELKQEIENTKDK